MTERFIVLHDRAHGQWCVLDTDKNIPAYQRTVGTDDLSGKVVATFDDRYPEGYASAQEYAAILNDDTEEWSADNKD